MISILEKDGIHNRPEIKRRYICDDCRVILEAESKSEALRLLAKQEFVIEYPVLDATLSLQEYVTINRGGR